MGTKHDWRWASSSVSGCRSTNDTYMQLSGKRYVYTDITRKRCIHTDITPTACTHIYAQTIQTHRYHTNGTYTQSHNDAHNTTVRIHPDITQPVHRYHRTVRTQSHHTNGAYTLIAHPDSRQTIHAHRHHTNVTHTDSTQTLCTNRHHTNDTYTQISHKLYLYIDIMRKRYIHTDMTQTRCTIRYHTNCSHTHITQTAIYTESHTRCIPHNSMYTQVSHKPYTDTTERHIHTDNYRNAKTQLSTYVYIITASLSFSFLRASGNL